MIGGSKRPTVALVLHDQPERIAAVLRTIDGCALHLATTPDAVVPALERVRPEVVFSIKHSGFPGEFHRPAVLAPSVRWVQVGGSGYEHMAPWDPSRVRLTHCAGVLSPFLADTVLAAVLAWNQQLLRYRDQQRARQWSPRTFRALAGQTLCVVGLGAVGTELARRARGLGLRVIAVRRHAAPHASVDAVFPLERLHDALAQADVVSVHARRSPETEGLFDAAAFAAIKPGAYFVNTARGALVNEPALLAALRSGHLGGAYLDVFADEPIGPESPFWTMDSVLVSPHASDNVDGWSTRFAERFAENVARYRAGEALVGLVRA